MRKFTPEEDDFLRANYMTIPAKRMAGMLGRYESTARQRMKLLGIVVPREIVEKFKRESHYKKGNVPMNKGKSWTEYMSEEGMANSRRSTFKKGNQPYNIKSDLEVSIRIDKRGVNYKFIRVDLSEWIPLLKYNWQKVNGPVPEGYNLIHADGNTMNCEASNGLLLTNAELMKKNSIHNYPKEIANTIQLMGVLKRKINSKLKKTQNEK